MALALAGSKFSAEGVIEQLSEEDWKVDFSNLGLTSVRHTDHLALVREVDLSRNRISSARPLAYLLSVQRLILDDNQLESCDGLGLLPLLVYLSLRNNSILCVADASVTSLHNNCSREGLCAPTFESLKTNLGRSDPDSLQVCKPTPFGAFARLSRPKWSVLVLSDRFLSVCIAFFSINAAHPPHLTPLLIAYRGTSALDPSPT